MAARPRMAAAPSPARTRPRSTARPPMPRAISPRTWSRPASPTAAPSSSPTPSASPKPLSIYVDLHGTGQVDEAQARDGARCEVDGPVAARHPRASRPQPADLRPHLRLRPFRPRAGGRRRLLLGEDRPRRRAPRALCAERRACPADRRHGRRRGAFYGRRKGQQAARRARRGLVRRPAAAPARRPPAALGDPPRRSSRGPVDEVWLEIGFGGGEHLLAAGPRATPHVGFIGCEPFVNGMAKLLAAIDARGPRQHPPLRRRRARRCSTALPRRLARPGLPALSRSLAEAPPPQAPLRLRRARWPRSPASCGRAGRSASPATSTTMSPGRWRASLRSPDFTWTAERADDWRQPFPGWPGTRYEAKAIREGRVPTYITVVRR